MELILLTAAIPFLVALLLCLIVYISCNAIKLGRLSKNFKMLTLSAGKFGDCKKLNVLYLEDVFDKKTPLSFLNKWNQMKIKISTQYTGKYIPNGNTFFPFDEMIESSCGRTAIKNTILINWILAILSAGLPILVAQYLFMDNFNFALQVAPYAFAATLILQLIFLLANSGAIRNAKKQHKRFIDTFNTIAPVCDSETALIINAIMENKITFESSTEKIINKLDGIAENNILPALKEAIKQIADMQGNGMKELASEFSTQLTVAISEKLNSFFSTVSNLNISLVSINDSLSKSLNDLNELIGKQKNVLDQANSTLLLAEKNQTQTNNRISEFEQKSFENNEKLAIQTANISDSINKLTLQNDMFIEKTQDILLKAMSLQQEISEKLKASQQQLTLIPDRIENSMENAGEKIAQSIKETTADNAEAIENLARQAQALKDDYDNYFIRIEDFTKTSNEEMEYHVQNVISKMSEDVGKILKDNIEANSEVLSDFKKSSMDILVAFKEQADSISLYANEINMDINELSQNLNSSISVFNDSLNNSVSSTISQFDSGLSELSLRIENTVLGISDAIEALPMALKKI